MELLILVAVGLGAWLLWRTVRSRPEETLTSQVSWYGVTEDHADRNSPRDELAKLGIEIKVSAEPSRPDLGQLTATGAQQWLLNPKSIFPLTLASVERATADEFKRLLDGMFETGPYDCEQELVPLLATSNAHIAEVDQYVAEFRPKYQQAIERLRQASSEWPSASEKDREDLLAGFRKTAIQQLLVRPDCDLEVLFEYEPSDATIDDELIRRYGFENLQVYLRHGSKLDKVHTIPADHRSRVVFDNLVKLGLAIRGHDIAVESLLSKLTLKEMTELVSDIPHPTFTRKAKAVELLKNEPTIRERLGKHISFRELFQLQPMPAEFRHIRLEELSRSWAHAGEVAALLSRTYWSSGWETLNRTRFADSGYSWIKGWEIHGAEHCCPSCEAHAGKTYASRSRLRVPLHIGCNCRLESLTS